MKIIFYTKNHFFRLLKSKKIAKQKINNIVSNLKSDTSIFNKIFFADETKYDKAIKSIDKNEGYTNSQNFVGFGKTIIQNKTSSIIYRIEILDAITKRHKTSISKEQAYYVLYHEIGHAIDNSIRKPKKIKMESIFNKKNISHYYIEVAVSEFAANWNSMKNINEVFFEELISLSKSIIEINLEEIKNIKKSIDYTLPQIQYGVADRLWSNLIELSKLFGVANNMHYNFLLTEFTIDKTTQLKMKRIFSIISNTYPEIPVTCIDEIYLTWEELYIKEF